MQNGQIEKINRSMVRGWLVIVVILTVTYWIEVIKGDRTVPYILAFMAVMMIPAAIVVILFCRKRDMRDLCYYIVAGYFLMYMFVMFSGSTQMVFCYILPMLAFLVLYHHPALIVVTGVATMFVNAAAVWIWYELESVIIVDSKDIEIQFAVLVMSFAGSFVATRLYDRINRERELYYEEADEKNREIQDMAMQTIVTIANTIDAKDEYTQGHSRRVAEYSTAIAAELGMDAEAIVQLKSIALLHDIGKIGVPDAVLNKPGKLTNEEYALMKQHTVIGAEILKDIGMLEGIDIGAKYHHERYDGKGYPDGLAGEDIPLIARIIAVADAFDAMTSNRVYRKQLDINRVLSELEKCSGTQFDPNAAKALLKLLKEHRLEPLAQKTEEEPTVRDMSRIWSRVLEKGEEKYKDKMDIDELTGLNSRVQGEKMIREAMSEGKGWLMLIDVDDFRKMNGVAGFLLGDILLREIADGLRAIPGDKILSRFGGDEFAAFFVDEIDRVSIEAKIKEYMETLARNTVQFEQEVEVSVSIGISICDGIYNNYHDILLDTEKALYLAKRQGGGHYEFYNNGEKKDGLQKAENADLTRLLEIVQKPGVYQYLVDHSPEFKDVAELIRDLRQNGRKIKVALLSLQPNEGTHVSVETQNEVLENLEQAVSRSIGGDDYLMRYSNAQRMVIMPYDNENEKDAVVTHIVKEFYKIYAKKEMYLSYGVSDLK